MRRVFHVRFGNGLISRASVFLLVIGLLQMTGDLLRVPEVKGLAAATGASPAPKVFSSIQGLETFSSDFYIEWKDRNGVAHSLKLTPEIYSRIQALTTGAMYLVPHFLMRRSLRKILAPDRCMTRSFAMLFADEPHFLVK
jgi:hypothetical protein